MKYNNEIINNLKRLIDEKKQEIIDEFIRELLSHEDIFGVLTPEQRENSIRILQGIYTANSSEPIPVIDDLTTELSNLDNTLTFTNQNSPEQAFILGKKIL